MSWGRQSGSNVRSTEKARLEAKAKKGQIQILCPEGTGWEAVKGPRHLWEEGP